MLRLVASLLLAFGLLLPLVSQADAQARLCRQLQGELTRLGQGGGNAKQYRRYDRALRKQAGAYNRLRAQYDAGCRTGFLGLGRRGGQCGQIRARMQGAKAQIGKLERMRNRFAGPGNARQIRRIRSAMRRANCGRNVRQASVRRRGGDAARDSVGSGYSRRGDTYRTMCVRSCDGFYFPVSFSTTRDRFASDEAACQSACPGADVSLYVHKNPGEGPEQMISPRGDAYASLPAAFQYKKTVDRSCSCGSASERYASIAAKVSKDERAAVMASVTAVPAFRPRARPGVDEPSIDGEDVYAAVTAAHDAVMRDGKRVRVVGPEHWSVRSTEEALLIPVPSGAR